MPTCDHLTSTPLTAPPAGSAYVCTDCVAVGGQWVHLRRCLGCDHVSCCDSSPARHATAHARSTGHPVVTSAEPGESWRWCYLDEVGG